MPKILPLVSAVAALAGIALSATPAVSQDSGWSFELGAATDNRSKNASKSEGDAFVHGTAQWESADGLFYAGPGFETIKSSGSDLEVEFSAGVRPQWMGFDLDLNAAHKWRLGSNPGVDDDAWEFTANLSRSIGPAKGRLQLQHSPDGAGSVRAWTWVEGRIGWAFTHALEGTASVGRREQNNAPDYVGWNAGLTWTVQSGVELDLRYHDTDAHAYGAQYDGALVAGLVLSF